MLNNRINNNKQILEYGRELYCIDANVKEKRTVPFRNCICTTIPDLKTFFQAMHPCTIIVVNITKKTNNTFSVLRY